MVPRALLASGALLAVFASCKAPEADGLFQPYDPNATRAAGAGGGGSGGGSSLPPIVPSSIDAGSRPEGQGGALGLAGTGGTGAVGGISADAGAADAGDAGPSEDAGLGPICSDNPELCDGLDNDCDGDADEGGACAGTCEGFALQGRGYMFCSDSVTRDTALARCMLEGMRLAWIETPQENAQLVDRIEAADVPDSDSEEILTFIGGSDAGDEGSWSWRGTGAIPDGFQFWEGQAADDGGEAVGGAYANWSDTEPNDTDGDEDCAVFSVLGNNNRAPGNWDDRNCDTELPFVCEVP